jgi:hypothetical protein
MALVCKRTILTKQPPLVAKLVPTSADRGCCMVNTMDPHSHIFEISRPEPLLFLPSSYSIVLTRLSGPRSRPTTQKIWQRQESNLDHWICSQELWPLDHRGGLTKHIREIKRNIKLHQFFVVCKYLHGIEVLHSWKQSTENWKKKNCTPLSRAVIQTSTLYLFKRVKGKYNEAEEILNASVDWFD